MRRQREAGYVLFGIAIGLVILGISMTAAVPLWQKIVQRERETELIFRGYQYMQAIELYQRKYPGAYPPNLDILLDEKFLRREYKDPFSESEDGSFRFIRQLSPELQQGAQQQQEAAGRAAGLTDLNRSQGRMRAPGQQTPGSSGAAGLPGGQFQSTMGRGASDQSLGGIVGVASSSDEVTFYKVPGKDKYKDWLFVYGAQQQQGAAVPVVQPGGQAGAGAAQSPFPGLPPPPGLTSFRFGSGPMGPAQQPQPNQPGQILPGQPGSGVQPGQPSVGQPAGPTQQPGFGQPGGANQRRNPPRQP
jgi:type II secretory pathway pseudopilin PulG